MIANAILMVTTAFMWSCSLGVGAEYQRRTWWKDTQKPETSNESINKAIKFMLEADKSLMRFSQMISRARWDWSVNITEENRKVKVS
ncbi:hypothetical protein TNCT_704801 [Trichonephila clavata]|uniref:Uncharacterized protein n=1 Tax=Trichonephila clavata TaxID=2740835 RepID=A0A8X6H279_TRICU|nr:hypothetical protein TNCT_704801 [Trichonephila clavata]